jgi:hypothetical protein
MATENVIIRAIQRAMAAAGITLPVPVSLVGPAGNSQGLVYYGLVTAVPGANQFTIPTLAGYGAGKFAGAAKPYYAFVFRDNGGAGAAPQGEQLVVTAYATATGTFTTAAFTAAVAAGDEILIIHADVAEGGAPTVPVPDSVSNTLSSDVVGNKADTANIVIDAASSLMRWVKGILFQINLHLSGVVTTGTFSLVNNILEQDCIVIAANNQLVDIELDMNLLAQTNTVREYVKTDGANYQQISAKIFPTAFDTGTKVVLTSFVQKNCLYKITLQATVLEGAATNIPWRQMVRSLT